VVIFIALLAGLVPLLQVTFFALLEDFYLGRLAVKDRDKTHRIIGLILYHVVSDYWVSHREYFLLRLIEIDLQSLEVKLPASSVSIRAVRAFCLVCKIGSTPPK
jgi:hypothetical protein